VTDGRQQLHFQQLFAVFRRWHPESKMKLAHVWFGSILGEDGKALQNALGRDHQAGGGCWMKRRNGL